MLEKNMKAVRINKTGGIEVLEYGDYPMPVMKDNDVLVKVMTTAVSAWDIKYRRGDIFGKTKHSLPGRKSFPLPQQLGREAAGIVIAVGETVTAFNVGDRVMGLVHPENQMSKNALMGLGNLSTGIDYPGHVMLGGYAQYVSRPENYWLKMPDNLSFDVVAAGAWSYLTWSSKCTHLVKQLFSFFPTLFQIGLDSYNKGMKGSVRPMGST